MGQELLLKDVGGPFDSLITSVVGSVSLPGDVVQRIFSCANGRGFFQTGPQHIYHIRVALVVNHQVLDLLVSNNV
jgi:hypothetical protein